MRVTLGAAYPLVMYPGRGLVDYGLRRRLLLAEVSAGSVDVDEVCDADPYLLRAARYHGVMTAVTCPMCRKEPLTHVYWVFGSSVGAAANSARTPDELEELAERYTEFTVHQVEVCRTCSWNFLIASFVMGRPRGQRRTAARAAR